MNSGETGQQPSADSGHSHPGSAGENARRMTNELKHRAAELGREQADKGRARATSEIDAFSERVDAVTDSLKEHDFDMVANWTSSASDTLSNASDYLRERSANDVIKDITRTARQNPTLFVLGSIAAGFALSRVMRAGSTDESAQSRNGGVSANGTGGGYGSLGSQARDQAATTEATGNYAAARGDLDADLVREGARIVTPDTAHRAPSVKGGIVGERDPFTTSPLTGNATTKTTDRSSK